MHPAVPPLSEIQSSREITRADLRPAAAVRQMLAPAELCRARLPDLQVELQKTGRLLLQVNDHIDPPAGAAEVVPVRTGLCKLRQRKKAERCALHARAVRLK